jgi:hypothetical protein
MANRWNREIDSDPSSPSHTTRIIPIVSPRIVALTLGSLLSAVVQLGCNRAPEGPDTIAVSGTVTYQGRPVEGANVIFHPTDGSTALASQAVTDANGRYELATHVGVGKFKPGIEPGKYAVALTKLDTAGISTTLAPPKNLLPQKYANQSTSGLTADVARAQENTFDFALSD